jgi:hypothetical protein
MNHVTVELSIVMDPRNMRRARSSDQARLVCFSQVVDSWFVHSESTLSTGNQQPVPSLSGLVVHRHNGTEWGVHGW